MFSYWLPYTQTGRKVSQADTCFDKFWSLKFESDSVWVLTDKTKEVLKTIWSLISKENQSKDEKGKK